MDEYKLDCGDNDCLFIFPKERRGMRTNGGCRCLGNLGLTRIQERPIRMWAINAPRKWREEARLAALRKVREMIEKRTQRNISRAKAMREQCPDSELYGETEHTYLKFVQEDSDIRTKIDAMIAKEER